MVPSQQSNHSTEHVANANQAARPGTPKERSPAPVPNAHWTEPEKQPARSGLVVDPTRGKLTATFGSQHPPAGISGALRRAAYELPDYRARRWAMLILADRVDALESKLARVTKQPISLLTTSAKRTIHQLRSRRDREGAL